jgi:hypothetical protein
VHINLLVIQLELTANPPFTLRQAQGERGGKGEGVGEFPFVLSLSKHEHNLVRTVPEF